MATSITFVKSNHNIIATEFIESDDGFDKTSDYKLQAYEIIENDDGTIKLANYSSSTKSNHILYCNEILEDTAT